MGIRSGTANRSPPSLIAVDLLCSKPAVVIPSVHCTLFYIPSRITQTSYGALTDSSGTAAAIKPTATTKATTAAAPPPTTAAVAPATPPAPAHSTCGARVLCGSYNSKERGGAALLVIDNQNILTSSKKKVKAESSQIQCP